MEPNIEVAEEFGNLIAKADYSGAHALLTEEAQKIHSPEDFRKTIEEMTDYAPGPVREVSGMQEFVLYDWPDKRDGEIAYLYVGLIGDSYVEAATATFAVESGALRIRNLEWERP